MTVDRIGHGAGTADRSIANMLRLFIGFAPYPDQTFAVEQTATIETTIDDMNPQIYDYLMEKVLEMGALDIFFSTVQMKKNRRGTLVTILCRPEQVTALSDFLFRETTTIGLRWRLDNRFTLHRDFVTVKTRFGAISCKTATMGDALINVTPEYDDCKRVAIEQQVPLKTVLEEPTPSIGVRSAAEPIEGGNPPFKQLMRQVTETTELNQKEGIAYGQDPENQHGPEGEPRTTTEAVGDYAGLGGRALTTAMVAKEVPATCHALGAENKLVIAPRSAQRHHGGHVRPNFDWLQKPLDGDDQGVQCRWPGRPGPGAAGAMRPSSWRALPRRTRFIKSSSTRTACRSLPTPA